MAKITPMIMSLTLLLAPCTTMLGQQSGYFESFENGIPAHFTASRGDSLSLSSWHYKHGENSLRWDWQTGDELVIRHGIGAPARRGEFSARASFSVWLYMEEPMQGELLFEFREGETVTGSFRFPLQFTGWRQGRPFYHAFPSGQPTSEVDNIRIVAPTDTPQGTVFVDFIKYNTLTHGGNAVVPDRVMRWERPSPDLQRFPLPERVTDEELAGIRKLLGPAEGSGVQQARVDGLCAEVEALGIVRDEHGIHGPGIDAHYQFFPTATEAARVGAKPAYWSDEHGPNWEGMQTPGPLSSLAYNVAVAYRASNDNAQRERLAEAYLLISDHLQDQALQAGSGFKWNWWVGGQWADSVFLMRDLLAQEGRLRSHIDYLMYTWGADALVGEGDPPSHMDFYHLTVLPMFRQCLMQVEPAEQVRWLNAFKSMIERSIMQSTSAFKIDGSTYHHSAHYPGYAGGAFTSLSKLLAELKDTPWAIDAATYERVRRAALAQRLYCNHADVPVSLHGRHPMRSTSRMNVEALNTLARTGTLTDLNEIDVELAAAYLRLMPDAANSKPYRDLEIMPEPHPEGTFVMPYAGMLSHRRDDWLVSLRGQSKYVWASERQDHHNRFGVFHSLGQLEVLSGGNPVTAKESGWQNVGWDWARFEGTTVPHLPLQRLSQAWPANHTYSRHTFMGGLSHRGSHGAFGMILDQTVKPETSFAGKKSWFFVDNQIICLGSNISCDEPEYPLQTNLCQKGLAPNDEGDHAPIIVDGEQIIAFPDERQLDPARPHWFIDPYQVGYYLPAGQTATVARQHQTSRSTWDEVDTEGDMLVAWIDHEVAPTDGDYEYMLVVRATPDTMQNLSVRPPYQVIQCDQNAHIIRHAATGLWGCVLFDEQELAAHTSDGDTLPVRSVDRACLVMAETADGGQLHLSVADPDLNLVDGVNEARTMQITLRGQWRLIETRATVCAWELEGAADKAKIVSADANETVLEIICEHGASYDLNLARG
jgi:chondroitin-sulfate-ABC endolyase/exolyase